MGLDGVEIILAVEERFDIRIEDAEAEKLLTPRQLIELVQTKVALTTASVCLTQRAFNLLRKSLRHHGGWKRSEITPASRLSDLIPRPERRPLLQRVVQDLAINKPPQLELANWLNISLLLGSLAAGGLAVRVTRLGFSSPAMFVFIAGALLAAGAALRLTMPWRKEFPANLQTVGDLSRWVMTHKADLAMGTAPAWTRNQIAASVREIIVDQLGCQPDFSEEASFTRDLGLN